MERREEKMEMGEEDNPEWPREIWIAELDKARDAIRRQLKGVQDALATPTAPLQENTMTDLNLRGQIAITLWRNEAVRAAPNVAKQRTDEAFLDANDDDRRRWMNHADAILELIEGAVKPLEWSKRNDPNEPCVAADCQWGRYKIVYRGEYGLGVYTPRSGPTMGYFENVEAAKAAAQADYEHRILAALGVK